MGTLMGDMEKEGVGSFTGDLEEKVQKILETGVSRFRDPLGNQCSC